MTARIGSRIAVVGAVAATLVACSSDGTTSEIVDAARDAATTAACAALSSIADDLASASTTDGGAGLAARGETLADSLDTAAGALEAAGGGEAADELRALADDLASMAQAAPEEIQSNASDASDGVEAASSSLDCPG